MVVIRVKKLWKLASVALLLQAHGGCASSTHRPPTLGVAAPVRDDRISTGPNDDASPAVVACNATENLRTTPFAIPADWRSEELPQPDDGRQTSQELPSPLRAQLNVPRKLTLREAIDTALLQSPDAITARAGAQVTDATRVVSSTYPWNPSVQVNVDPYARDQQGNFLATRNEVTLTQTLELAHQPKYRRKAADASWSQQRATIAQSELTAVIAGMRAYFDALYRKGLYDTASKTAQLQMKSVEVLQRRVQANLSPQTDRLTASVAARQSARQATLADNDYQLSLSTLRAALGLPRDQRFELADDLHAYRFRAIADVLHSAENGGICDDDASINSTDASIENRPDIIASRFAVAAARANLDLAQANVVPNLTAGPRYERDESGTLFFGVSAQMDIPVWNTGCPLVRQRAAELRQQITSLNQTRTRAELQADAAIRRYSRAYAVLHEFSLKGDSVENDIKSIEDAFRQGQATIVEVLSVQDNLNQEQKAESEILNEIAQAAIDVIAALSIDPELLIDSYENDRQGPAPNGTISCPSS